jgi:hypothetical protein
MEVWYLMGLAHSPRIVTSGLVGCWDAANPRSYIGYGTTWTELSTVSSSITLQSGVTYNSSKYLTFDGTANGYAEFSVSNLSTTTTVEMFAKFKSFSSYMPFGWSAYDVYGYTGALGYNTANSDVYGLTATQVTDLGLLNNWIHYVFEMRSDVVYTNNKIYINGKLQTLSQVLGAEFPANRVFNSGNGRLAGWRTDVNYRMPMDLAAFRVYNRALTTTEITQNFNSARWRFGV